MRVHKQSLIERLLYPYVRRIVAAYDDARRLTWKHCPSCKTPLVDGQANFCHICGTCLVPQLPAPQPASLVDDISPTTDAISLASIEKAVQEARTQAKVVEPPTTMTGRFKAYKLQGERPMKAWQKAIKDK